MCDECHRNPCHPRCPNAIEPPVIETCDNCNGDIHVGETYYEIDGETICEECIAAVVQSKSKVAVQEEINEE